ncbi:aspartyl-phosphate phosphatase Spo0E family protein [Desnuesiella massiliensis]|uniref:aspartyl-phosphate phosphatase Spo0E family protein n=1 Tax=Desnuesiella massiliensis TaxID=1650662 RepID=UPI0006E16073|nr:aspartyl-phosphate phosphatase Spo0E family protein [Desnuesiella massiliensis]
MKKWLPTKIKLLRKALHILLLLKSPTNKYVVKCSQELDKLIVEYQKSIIKPKRNKVKSKAA